MVDSKGDQGAGCHGAAACKGIPGALIRGPKSENTSFEIVKEHTMRFITLSIVATALLLGSLLLSVRAVAHCDTMDGPVARAGLVALETGSLVPALRWVSADQESELQHVFETARALGGESKAVREIVNRYFLETLVRLHRASEGAPYTGLKPAGTPIAPVIHHAEAALSSGSGSDLMAYLNGQIQSGVEQRLHHALETARHADDSIEQGREAVDAYVEFVHYVEAIESAAAGAGAHAHDDQNPAVPDVSSTHADH